MILEIISLLIIIGITIFFHELGHAIAAILCGIKVDELAIGFGPKILQFKIKDTKFTIRLIPLGGFTKFKDDKEFDKLIYSKKAFILLSGVSMNFILLGAAYLIHYGNIVDGLALNILYLKTFFNKDIAARFMMLALYVKSISLFNLELINLTCGIGNLIPIPPLDGSQLLTVNIRNRKIRSLINQIGLVVVLGLVIWLNIYLLRN